MKSELLGSGQRKLNTFKKDRTNGDKCAEDTYVYGGHYVSGPSREEHVKESSNN